jgi:hypothetical protein
MTAEVPRTIPEILDAAARVPDNGEAFGLVLNSLFDLAARAKDEADDD